MIPLDTYERRTLWVRAFRTFRRTHDFDEAMHLADLYTEIVYP